jgi:AraC-like DNA-binding protein
MTIQQTALSIPSAKITSKSLGKLIALAKRAAPDEGVAKTDIPFLTIIHNTRQTPPIRAELTPSFCLILQGTKRIHFKQDIIDCRPGNFLASVINVPTFAQVVGATKFSPYLGLRVDFTGKEIVSVMTEAGLTIKPKGKKLDIGAFIGKADAELFELFIRLFKVLKKPNEIGFVSELIKREMIFNLLSGDYGHLFFQLALFDQQANEVGKAVTWIEKNLARSFTVEELAKAVNMSVSGLHHKFKAITTMSPLQYQKQLRLEEAGRLLLDGSMDVTTAAMEVGYESPSQFNREYKRLFGQPPLRHINALREILSVARRVTELSNRYKPETT